MQGFTGLTAPGERGWFTFYAIAAFAYRQVITFSIVLFLAGKAFTLGIALAVWALVTQVGMPLWKLAAYVLTNPAIGRQRTRAVAVSGLLSAALVALVVALPVPLSTRDIKDPRPPQILLGSIHEPAIREIEYLAFLDEDLLLRVEVDEYDESVGRVSVLITVLRQRRLVHLEREV